MFISRLSLKNFGPFELADFSFAPTGISVIYGPNGSGKTQITGAILAAAVGRRAIKIDKKGIGPTKVQVSIEEGDAAEEISLVVSMTRVERL
jgi:predicted ATP-binding protein involved in virulence